MPRTWIASTSHQAWKPLLAGLFAGLWLMDVATTMAFVHRYGLEMEANLLVRWVMAQSMGWFVGYKALTLVGFMALQHRMAIWIHCCLVAILIPVVYLNVHVAWL